MSSSVLNLYRAARRRLQRLVRKSKDGEEVRRATALLHLDRSGNASEAAASVAAARSSLYRWVSWFAADDVEGLRSLAPGRNTTTVTDEVVELLMSLLETRPTEFGYLRATWTSELLALEVRRQLGGTMHASTVRRLLPDLLELGRYRHPWLGVRYAYALTPGLAEMLNLPVSQGLLLVQMYERAPLDIAGVRGAQREAVVGNQRVYVGGDILLAINDAPVARLEDLEVFLEDNFRVGDVVAVRLLREGNEFTVQVELAEEPN